MRMNTNLSDSWRVNKSQVEHIELANALKALRKVVGYLGLDAEVVWAGMTPAHEDKIRLPSFLALGEYPIPAKKMDMLVGFAIHQSFHLTENSQYALNYLSHRSHKEIEKRLIRVLVETGEDIHVDGVVLKRGILLSRYVQKFRTWLRENYLTDLTIGGPLTPNGVLGTWASIIIDNIFPHISPESLNALQDFSDLELLVAAVCPEDKALESELRGVFSSIRPEYREPLRILLSKTKEIIDGDPTERAVIYGNLWSKLGELFVKWKRERAITEEGRSTSGEKTYELPPGLADVVEQTLTCDAQDINSLIENSLKSVGGENRKWLLFPTVYKHSTELCKTPPDPELSHRLREIFRLQGEETLRMNRGLRSGKVDGRRLYRVPITDMIFKCKESIRVNKWNVAVLLDASSSMKKNWKLVESTCATLTKAWREQDNKLEVFAYAESQQTCTITTLFNKDRLFSVTPSGSTPSGQAIIATALLMPEGDRRLILHITDGMANVGVDIDYALKFCEGEKIDLVTIGRGEAVTKLKDRYGNDRFEIMNSVEQLPNVIESLLRRRLLRRKWR
jgi:hypothetical protein